METLNAILEKIEFSHQNIDYELLHINEKILDDDLIGKYAELIVNRLIYNQRPLSNISIDDMILRLKNPTYVDYKIDRYLVIRKEELIGYIHLSFNTGTQNGEFMGVNTTFNNSYLHQGLEKACAQLLIDIIPDHITKVSFWTRKGDEEDNDFQFDMIKFSKHAFTDRASGSKIQDFNPMEVKEKALELKKIAGSKGYEFLFLNNAEFKIHEKLDYSKYLKIVEEIWNSMPKEDASWEDEVVTEELHQSFYKNREILKQSIFTIVAMFENNPVGYTETWLTESNRAVAQQEDTGVIKNHWGNNLGLTLKYLMLDKLLHDEKASDVVYWTTGNAKTNAPMIRINDILKYEELYFSHGYEISADDYKEFLS